MPPNCGDNRLVVLFFSYFYSVNLAMVYSYNSQIISIGKVFNGKSVFTGFNGFFEDCFPRNIIQAKYSNRRNSLIINGYIFASRIRIYIIQIGLRNIRS